MEGLISKLYDVSASERNFTSKQGEVEIELREALRKLFPFFLFLFLSRFLV